MQVSVTVCPRPVLVVVLVLVGGTAIHGLGVTASGIMEQRIEGELHRSCVVAGTVRCVGIRRDDRIEQHRRVDPGVDHRDLCRGRVELTQDRRDVVECLGLDEVDLVEHHQIGDGDVQVDLRVLVSGAGEHRRIDDVDQSPVPHPGSSEPVTMRISARGSAMPLASMTMASIRVDGRRRVDSAASSPSRSTEQHMHPLARLTAPSACPATNMASMFTAPKSLTNTPIRAPTEPSRPPSRSR